MAFSSMIKILFTVALVCALATGSDAKKWKYESHKWHEGQPQWMGGWYPKPWGKGHGHPPPPPTLDDTQILNFALNLEYLEAEFYSWAAYGHGLPDNLSGGGPPSTGGMKANLSAPALALAQEIANDEINHVAFLRSALGNKAVPRPQIDIGAAFAAAANAAFGKPVAPPFSPYGADAFFFLGAYIFEDVGVTAYHGAAPLITSKTYLSAAAGILAIEANHAGAIRDELLQIKDVVTPYNVTVSAVTTAISALRAKLSGANDDLGIVNSSGGVVIAPADQNSIAFSRTPRQVLNIVYGAQNARGGLFFPQGINPGKP